MLSPLSSIDGAVKAHEWAHLKTLGPYAAGPIQYDFVIDAEGNRYAVGGSIPVDLNPIPSDPEATVRKAKAILQAAYAPGNPSAADMQVAQKALNLLRQAEKELAELTSMETKFPLPRQEIFHTKREEEGSYRITTNININRGTEEQKLYIPILYTPAGRKEPWFQFWFEGEPSFYRGNYISIWI
ncbi:MAG: putative metalloprotease CJM1_0395 family protein [Spirochaetales bacterium]